VTAKFKNFRGFPKEAMAHYWVLPAKEADPARFVDVGARSGARLHGLRAGILCPGETKLLGPGESDSVTFSAPTLAGAYTYLCTFPEHYAACMKRAVTVRI
jgi:azurin